MHPGAVHSMFPWKLFSIGNLSPLSTILCLAYWRLNQWTWFTMAILTQRVMPSKRKRMWQTLCFGFWSKVKSLFSHISSCTFHELSICPAFINKPTPLTHVSIIQYTSTINFNKLTVNFSSTNFFVAFKNLITDSSKQSSIST